MRITIFILVLILSFAVSGCQKSSPSFTKDTYPRVDGSTVTIPLSVDMAAQLLKMSQEEAQRFIKHNRTHEAYVNLLAGRADIIFVTEPSDEELALAKERNIELEVIPVVRDAFVFVVNKENPVESLTLSQLQKIYQGAITNWKEVGGPDKHILAYQRPKNSGSQTLMENLVMKGLPMMNAPTELVPAEMAGLVERVATYENADRALGYSVYYYANTMFNKETMKFIGVNGVKPNQQSIAAQLYPLSISYYAVIRKSEPQNSSARKLLAWLLDKDGQALAVKSGYVPLR